MSRSKRALTAAERFEATAAAVVIAIAIVGLALLPLTTHAFVVGLVSAVHAERDTGIAREPTLDAAEQVRVFVIDPSAPALPERVAGRAGFDELASAHLVDVRDVLVPARWLALALAAIALAWAAVRLRSPGGRRVVGAALTGGGGLLLGVAGLAVLAGALDFDWLFARFHGLFFEAGTWTFAYDALLIQVFPLRFWIAAGAAWGALVLVAAIGALVVGRRLSFTRGSYGV